jgi:anti-sigma factor RsiW
MSDCTSIDRHITPYIDGDIGPRERLLVDEHVRLCPPCHSRVAAEQAIRQLMHTKRTELAGDTASPALRSRCAALQRQRATLSPAGSRAGVFSRDGLASALRTRLVPIALAAGVVAAVGGASIYVLTARSSQLLAAELTADHVKCFGMNSIIAVKDDQAAAERTMASTFGWQMPLPEAAQRAGMELLGARVCLYGRGLAAHIMYRHNGQPVSVYMIPKMTRSDAVVDIMGHEAAIWSSGGRTFVLVAREPEADVERMTAVIQTALH